jgi:hypothetical protein
MHENLSSVTLYLDDEEVYCKVNLEKAITSVEINSLSERMGHLLALLSLGSLDPVITHGIAEYGIVSENKKITEKILIMWDDALKKLGSPKEKRERAVITPTEAFITREKQ